MRKHTSDIPSEHAEQAALVRYLRRNNHKAMAIPNGSPRSRREGAKLKAEGMEPGAPDVELRTAPPGEAFSVAIEMKRRDGGVWTKAEQEWADSVKGLPHWRYVLAYGAQDAVVKLRELGYDLPLPGDDL